MSFTTTSSGLTVAADVVNLDIEEPIPTVEEGVSSHEEHEETHYCQCNKEQSTSDVVIEEATEHDAFKAREEEIRLEYEEKMAEEINNLKARFELVLLNEQVRTSCLLREAQWQKQEKISALRTQLESKNLAALMHLLCSERKKNKHEIKRIIDEFTDHISQLTSMIAEGQSLMEEMILGYKTASKVDAEWRAKTRNILKEFQMFIEHYFGATPESSKFFFNFPALLSICSPLYPEDEPKLEVCTCEEQQEKAEDSEQKEQERAWYHNLDGPNKPFVVYGDMEYFHPTFRRELLAKVKNDKSKPPEKWKEYAFDEKFLMAQCPNLDIIKQKYLKYTPIYKYYCGQSKAVQVEGLGVKSGDALHCTGDSSDVGCVHMGSILRMITAAKLGSPKMVNKASILGARDSLELLSATKLNKEKRKSSSEIYEEIIPFDYKKKRTSMAPDVQSRTIPSYRESQEFLAPSMEVNLSVRDIVVDEETKQSNKDLDKAFKQMMKDPKYTDPKLDRVFRDWSAKAKAEEEEAASAKLASTHQDSLLLASMRSPNRSEMDRIVYEKECPTAECQRKNIDPLLRNLPPYLDFNNPYREYERTFESYEPITREQLDRLMALRPPLEKDGHVKENPSDLACRPSGVYVQTSDVSLCACEASTEASEQEPQLIEVTKQTMNHIRGCQMYSENIEMQRFKVIGQDHENAIAPPKEFATRRVGSIVKIVRKHPSLCSLFQSTTLC